jgi:hypothetical protein
MPPERWLPPPLWSRASSSRAAIVALVPSAANRTLRLGMQVEAFTLTPSRAGTQALVQNHMLFFGWWALGHCPCKCCRSRARNREQPLSQSRRFIEQQERTPMMERDLATNRGINKGTTLRVAMGVEASRSFWCDLHLSLTGGCR